MNAAPSLGVEIPIIDKFFKDFAKKASTEAAPAVRNAIGEERAKIAGALAESMPFVGLAGVGAVLTGQLMPPLPLAKTAGYLACVGVAGYGLYRSFSKLKTPPAPPPKPPEPTPYDSYIDSAVRALVVEVDPKAKAILDEERKRLVAAAKAGVPLLALGLAGAALTFLLMPDIKLAKAGAYAGSVGLGATGIWVFFDRLK